ncbi:MAG TPA: ABC transporter permease [Thermoanaerobaculia bacterium]|jgi:ABC-type nitrate/sulfonate/bicarbonate transport system permease component
MKWNFATARDRAIAAAIAAVLIALWEIAARAGSIDTLLFPHPSRIAATLFSLREQGLINDVLITIGRLMAGLALGAIPGVIVGLCVGASPRLHGIIDPFIAAIHPLPKIVLFPLFIVIFGIGEWAKVSSIALTVFFPTMINSAAGARQVSPLYHEVIRNYGGGRAARFRHVIIPGSLPMILNGIRVAVNLGLLVTVAMEFTVVSPGIGSIIWLALQTMRIEQLYAGIVIISVIGITLNVPIQVLLRRTAQWQ